MSTLSRSKMPTLKDKHLAQEVALVQEAEAKAAALEKADQQAKEDILKANKNV